MVRPGVWGQGHMGRGKRNFIDVLAGLPWPVGLVVGALGYLTLAHGVPAWFARQGGPFAQVFAGESSPLPLLAWVFLVLCAIGALASFLKSRRTRRLLDTRTGLESIAALGWRDFERLVGEAFRRRGYSVEETGLGGADGGIDLILRRDGRRILVQCKQWRRQRVPVNVVREMYGLMSRMVDFDPKRTLATPGRLTDDISVLSLYFRCIRLSVPLCGICNPSH